MVSTPGLRHTFHLWQRGLALFIFRHRSLRSERCRKNVPFSCVRHDHPRNSEAASLQMRAKRNRLRISAVIEETMLTELAALNKHCELVDQFGDRDLESLADATMPVSSPRVRRLNVLRLSKILQTNSHARKKHPAALIFGQSPALCENI